MLLTATTLTATLLLISHTSNSLRTYDLEHGQEGERYRYRDTAEVSSTTPSAHHGHGGRRRGGRGQNVKEDVNSNPVFPPRTDDFWEVDKDNEKKPHRGGRKRLVQERSEGQSRSNRESNESRSNIILILTDDQDIELGSMDYMPETLKAFREGGIEFRHGYVTTPMCCPSRSSMLTGMYVHNHQVYTNNDNCSSVYWRERFEPQTLAVHLQRSGYYTSYIGKYLNKYDGSHIPQGWDDWNALLMNSKFYNYTVNRNGVNVRYGNNYERDYYPDSIANDTLTFLDRMNNPSQDLEHDVDRASNVPKSRKPNQPFLLVVSFPSPHGPEDSAPQYSHLFVNSTSHHTPAYNYAPNSDKQWILKVTPKMNSNLQSYTNLLMAKRLQTLQSVDSAVKMIMESLQNSGLTSNTYVFYTSDHGYHVGQFGLIKGKAMPYEFDIRVPFFVKVPLPTASNGYGFTVLEPVLNIDLAPTFLDLAGIPVPSQMDGRSFVPLLHKYAQLGRHQSSQSSRPTTPWTRIFLVESSGRREFTNGPPAITAGPITVSEIQEFCDLSPYPCVGGQKKFCRRGDGGRLRFRKCPIEMEADTTCSCPKHRFKRQADWDSERKMIDEEIEALKKKIDELRDRKRLLKQHFLTTPSPTIGGSMVMENETVTKKVDDTISIVRSSGTFEEDLEIILDEEEDFDEDMISPQLLNVTKYSLNNSNDPGCDCSLQPRQLRQQERAERRRHKILSKLRKKQRFLKRIQNPSEREQAASCGDEDKMNCFWHDKDHWRTKPYWTGDSFCFCMNSHNNTFSCLRSINSTHNYLYCQFVTGFKMYFDLGRDPFQLRNAIRTLPLAEEDWMSRTLEGLKKCVGDACNEFGRSEMKGTQEQTLEPSIWEKVFGTRFRRKRVNKTRRQKTLSD